MPYRGWNRDRCVQGCDFATAPQQRKVPNHLEHRNDDFTCYHGLQPDVKDNSHLQLEETRDILLPENRAFLVQIIELPIMVTTRALGTIYS
jgi:hypothetical protein